MQCAGAPRVLIHSSSSRREGGDAPVFDDAARDIAGALFGRLPSDHLDERSIAGALFGQQPHRLPQQERRRALRARQDSIDI
jgi:hypothetical protein